MKSRDLWENDERFLSCVEQYTTMADRISNFAKTNREQVSPAFSDDTLHTIARNFEQFKIQLTNLDNDHYSDHKPAIYGDSKALMHTFEHLLSDDRIPMQARLDAIKNLAEKSTVCAGGLHTELSDVVGGLQFASKGLEGALVSAKASHIDALILAHVAEHHRYVQGDEVHFVNAYFNHIASDFGLDKRTDPLESIGLKESSEAQRTALGEKIKTKLDPLHLVGNIAEEYLGRVHDCLADAGVDRHQPLSGNELGRANQILNEHQSASWNRMFGEVPTSTYLKPTDDTYTSYHVAKSSVAITLHLMDQLKEKEFLDYAPLTLEKQKETGTEIKMVGSLLLTQNDGERDVLEIQQLLKIEPAALLKKIDAKLPEEQRGMFMQQLVRYALDRADPAKADSFSDTWMRGMIEGTLEKTRPMNGAETIEQKRWLGSVAACAAACNGEKTLDALIDAGVPLANSRDWQDDVVYKKGNDPIKYALENGHLNIAEKLFSAGVPIDKRRNDTYTAYSLQFCAAKEGQVEALKWLNQKGLELNPRLFSVGAGNAGYPMSYWFAKSGNVRALEALDEVGVNVMDGGPRNDGTALDAAFDGANPDTFGFLIDKGIVKIREEDLAGQKNEVFMRAIETGETAVVDVFLERGTDIHLFYGDDGRTPAIDAAAISSKDGGGNIFPHLVTKDPTTFFKVCDYLKSDREDKSDDQKIKGNLKRAVDLLPKERRAEAKEILSSM